VPKAIALDGDKPRRRRGGSVAVDETAERGLAMRILLHSPKDTVAGAIAFVAVSAIIGNAVFMQAGRHPSPMFGGNVGMPMAASAPTSPLPRPRPIEADARPLEAKSPDVKSLDTKSLDTKSTDVRSSELHPVEARPLESRPADPLANQIKATGAPSIAPSAAPANVMRPPAPIPSTRNDPVGDLITSSHRVASVQRALTEYGYGQLKPTGTVGSDTQAAIQKFERDRKIPVTGQMSDRLVRELTAMTGRPID
jgi:Putative peptidoglycan binding domain